MKFGKDLLSPSYHRTADFDSVESPSKTFELACVNCPARIKIRLDAIIGNKFKWHEEWDEDTRNDIARHFDMNAVGKTPDGGWTAIDSYECSECRTK